MALTAKRNPIATVPHCGIALARPPTLWLAMARKKVAKIPS
jgi:GTP-dependent phosphoenolpyruvate carboxykinase